MVRREHVPSQGKGSGVLPTPIRPTFPRESLRQWLFSPSVRRGNGSNGLPHYTRVFALVAAATLIAAGCQAAPGGEPGVEESSTVETTTVVAEPTPLALETPAIAETEVATDTSPTPATPLATPTITLTPTPSTTPVPPGPAVKSSARTLSAKLTAFRSALRSQGRPERAAQLQLELLSEAQKAEAALKDDQSDAAKQVREAIASIRAGAAGNTMSLDDAAMTLREIVGADGEGTPTVDGTPLPGQGTLNGAGGRSLGQPDDPLSLAELLGERIASYQQAQRERNTENLLRRQAELVEAMNEASAALEGDESAEAKRLRDAIANLTKGLRGDPQALSSGISAVQALGGTASQGEAADDLPKLAQDIESKLATVRDALSANADDPSSLLRHQRELLQEVDRAEKAIEGDTTPEAEKLRSALSAIRGGSSGDRAKLDSAAEQLRQLRGGPVASADGDSASPAIAVDTTKAAEQLQEKVDAMQRAIDRGSNDEILRAQRELMDAVSKIEPGLEGQDGAGANALHGAIEAIRNGLGGDVGKFEDAERQLSQITGRADESSASGTPASGNRAGASNGRSVDVKPIADSIAGALEKYAKARQGDDPQAVEQARADAEAELDRIADDLPASGPEAQKIRDLLNQARGAVSGDEAKLEAAREALEKARR